MTTPIGDAVEHELGVVIRNLDAARRVWHDITGHLHPHPYHDNHDQVWSPPKGTTAVSLTQDVTEAASAIHGWIDKLASSPVLEAVGRHESAILDVITVLDTVPGAEAILTPVLAGLKALAAVAPAASAPVVHDAAGEASADPAMSAT